MNCIEAGFDSLDQTRLFYRAWPPRQAGAEGAAKRALVFLHRGHEHSGRIEPLVRDLGYEQDWAFAWDARGHGHSPGNRGDAPDFQTLVQDLDAFVQHLCAQYGVEMHNIVLVANSVGAVVAATWLNDYAPRIRGVVMAAPAFDINLYVPLAKPALRLALGWNPELNVTSYIKPGMLTHSVAEAQAYGSDPLITKIISARVLVDLADTAQRVVQTAASVDTPVLVLVAQQDYVVKPAPQRRYFDGLSSAFKRLVVLQDCRHAIFYEAEAVRARALQETRSFVDACFARAAPGTEHYLVADQSGHGALQYQALHDAGSVPLPKRAFYALQRLLLNTLGRSSAGMRIGHAHGFDSGASLDHVYGNQASGRWLVGKGIDRGYLDAVGWRGIRLRSRHMQQLLSELIARQAGAQPFRILDIAAGGGRYLLETAKRFQDKELHLTLRDFAQHNLDQAQALASALALGGKTVFERRDAFAEASYADAPEAYDVVIVSGLYELFAENAPVLRSLQCLVQQLKPGGHLVYTGQPWHPQLELIAHTLTSHTGQPWRMRPRPQAEIDALVRSVGLQKVATRIGLQGIFTVSVAQKPLP